VTWLPMAHDIETERLILRLRDGRDAEWYPCGRPQYTA
jgi:hypothetical protein